MSEDNPGPPQKKKMMNVESGKKMTQARIVTVHHHTASIRPDTHVTVSEEDLMETRVNEPGRCYFTHRPKVLQALASGEASKALF